MQEKFAQRARLYSELNKDTALIYPPALIFILLEKVVHLFYILNTGAAPSNKGLRFSQFNLTWI